MVTVEAKEPEVKLMPPWGILATQKFGSHAVAGEGSLHLGTVEYLYALQAIDRTLYFDGSKWPFQALKCNGDWTHYKGISRVCS